MGSSPFLAGRQPRMIGMIGIVAIATGLVVDSAAATQPAQRTLPPSLTQAERIGPAPQLIIDTPVDVAALLAEDAAAAADPRHAGPYRFAATHHVSLSPQSHGRWQTLDDGWAVWQLEVVSPGALSLSARIAELALPDSALLWLHDRDGAQLLGPFTASDRDRKGGLSTPVVIGDHMVLEVLTPGDRQSETRVAVNEVYHGYRGFGEDRQDKRGDCNINVVCPEGDGWRDQIRSAARYTIGSYLCSGNLINNTAGDDRPLFITAGHCEVTEDNAHTMVVYWNYQTATCEEWHAPSPTQYQIGATHLVTWGDVTSSDLGGDVTLVELSSKPNSTYNVYYAGWDASDSVPQGVVAIHHPGGDEKSISFENDPLVVDNYLSLYGDNNWLRVDDWDLGTTEGGSSGSCIFDQTSKLCVGTLSGGYAACGNDDPDWFAWVHRQWEGGGTSDTRLRDLLDPIGMGVTSLQGKNPSGGSTQNPMWLIPAAASTPGYGSSNWKTQIAIVNHASFTRSASLYYVERGDPWPGVQIGSYSIGTNKSLYLDDPLLPQNPTSGLMYVTFNQSGPVVTTRTYNLASGGATYGQGIPGINLQGATAPTELILPLAHSIPNRFHSNLGLVQTSAGSYTVNIVAYNANGTILSQKSYTMTAAYYQINDLFRDLGLAAQSIEGGWVLVQLTSGSPAFWTAYISIVDDLTGDPTFVMPERP